MTSASARVSACSHKPRAALARDGSRAGVDAFPQSTTFSGDPARARLKELPGRMRKAFCRASIRLNVTAIITSPVVIGRDEGGTSVHAGCGVQHAVPRRHRFKRLKRGIGLASRTPRVMADRRARGEAECRLGSKIESVCIVLA